TQITSQADGKLQIVGGNLVGNQPCFQTRVMHARRESGPRGCGASLSLRMFWVESAGRRIIWDCEWIERILNRHANAFAAYSEWMGRVREHIRRKSRRGQGAIQKTAHVFKITKNLQVLAQNFAVERAVEVFTIHWNHCRCESGEIKELFAPRKRRQQTIFTDKISDGIGRNAVGIHLAVRRRCTSTAIKLWLVNKISNASCKVARPIIA